MKRWGDRFGDRREICSDRGPQFANQYFLRLCSKMGARSTVFLAGRHQGNSKAENTCKQLRRAVAKAPTLKKGTNWATFLRAVVRAWHETTGPSGCTPLPPPATLWCAGRICFSKGDRDLEECDLPGPLPALCHIIHLVSENMAPRSPASAYSPLPLCTAPPPAPFVAGCSVDFHVPPFHQTQRYHMSLYQLPPPSGNALVWSHLHLLG